MFFVVGRADASRNNTQSAADSAALAAAEQSRDQLGSLFVQNVLDGSWLQDIFSGNFIGTYDGCYQADRFAHLNGAGDLTCQELGTRWGFTVTVRSQKPIGKSLLPGTENKHMKAESTAVVEPRCQFVPAPPKKGKGGSPSPTPPGGNGGGSGGNNKGKKVSPGTIRCDNRDWNIDPNHLDLLPSMADLFRVRLAEN
jgi:hypothetical protein